MDDTIDDVEGRAGSIVRRPPVVLGSVEFGDDAIEVKQFPDGVCLITNGGGTTQVSDDQLWEVVKMFHTIGKQRGWL